MKDERDAGRPATADEPAQTHGSPAADATRGGSLGAEADTTQPRGDARSAAPEPYAAAHAGDADADAAEIASQGVGGDGAPAHGATASAHGAAAHGADPQAAAHGEDAHGHHETPLGPVDWSAWGAGAAGVALGLVVALCMLIALNWVTI